jgi:hypothetical protein
MKSHDIELAKTNPKERSDDIIAAEHRRQGEIAMKVIDEVTVANPDASHDTLRSKIFERVKADPKLTETFVRVGAGVIFNEIRGERAQSA